MESQSCLFVLELMSLKMFCTKLRICVSFRLSKCRKEKMYWLLEILLAWQRHCVWKSRILMNFSTLFLEAFTCFNMSSNFSCSSITSHKLSTPLFVNSTFKFVSVMNTTHCLISSKNLCISTTCSLLSYKFPLFWKK